MLNTIYRLVSPRQIVATTVEEIIDMDSVVVRPLYLSICHADQRYYTGTRDKKVLRKKLPMALIHEGMGEVVRDETGQLKIGQRVIIVPNTPFEESKTIEENYLESSKFRSSGYDGLMQEYVVARRDRLVEVLDEVPSNVAAYTELISVAMHSISNMERVKNIDKKVFGIWGDGNLGYITANLLRAKYPESEIVVIGKNEDKLNYFSFVSNTYTLDNLPDDLVVSHAFECVGGSGSKDAIEQIIRCIKPRGSIAIMGVSENPIEINTRLILEKGLTVCGTSRSGVKDFEDTIAFLAMHKKTRNRFENLIGMEKNIRNIDDIHKFFEDDIVNCWGKSVMRWKM